MQDREYHAFEEKLGEMAQALRAPWPIADGLTKHLWLAARGFDLATFRKACDDLISTLDFFPKPAELRRACDAYGRVRTEEERPFRCMHLDYTRLPLPDDVAGRQGQAPEKHWRCPAIFEYEVGQIYCPMHRKLYASDGKNASGEEISEAFSESLAGQPQSSFLREVTADRARRLAMGEHPVRAALQSLLGAIGKTMPDDHDAPEVVQQRKEDQKRRAIEAGVLAREPGDEG